MSVAAASQKGIGAPAVSPRYKWMVLANTTVGTLLATIDSSIMLIAMPAIFHGIHLDPLQKNNSFYLLWMILGYPMVSSVLVVSFGRLGDMFGRVKMYNFGFVVYTVFSLVLTVEPLMGAAGAMWLIIGRVVQAIGAAFLAGNSGAILTDAFPSNQRGLALGIGNIAGISGSFIGLILGGVLAAINWRLIFLVSVPLGLAGTLWSYFGLKELGQRRATKIDWPGNVTFAGGMMLLMIGITFGIEPANGQPMGWSSLPVLTLLGSGTVLMAGICDYRNPGGKPDVQVGSVQDPGFYLRNTLDFLSAMGRGGLMFMLIVWLQGIWLPLHGYSFAQTPFWAGILMLPLTLGFLLAGPVSGYLSDRLGARVFTTGGMLVAGSSFVVLILLPINFYYPEFALILLVNGLAMGAFSAPNRAAIMNSLPPADRGAGGGMNSTFQNAAQVFSIGIFFTLILSGFSATLETTLTQGLLRHGVPIATASQVGKLPPVSILFAAFLGYNPIQTVVNGSVLQHLAPNDLAALTGIRFFPDLIAPPFHAGLGEAFIFAALMCFVAAAASWTRGRHYVHAETEHREAPGRRSR